MISLPASRPSLNASLSASFDALAPEYDAVWSDSFIGRLQRRQIWRELDPIFGAGDRILELGCGTGIDAAHLAGLGIRVHATDISPQMLCAARERIQETALTQMVTYERMSIECLSDIQDRGPYDGALSNFGGFNCVQVLDLAAANLARLIHPGGKLVICWMGRFCFWETLWYLLHANPAKAFRRLWARTVGMSASLKPGYRVRVFYPSVSDMVAVFHQDFDLVLSRSIGILVPPSYAERWASTRQKMFERLTRVDDRVGRWPLLRGIGDHRLAVFIRKAPEKVSGKP